MKRLKLAAKSMVRYTPHVGYVGSSPMKVPNYLFSSQLPSEGYQHCRTVVRTLKERSIADEYVRSRQLTEFIQKRGLSFAKWNGRGYEEFSVPCAPLALPIPKSLFERLQGAAQVLVGALRCVLQDIYGEKLPERSSFVKALPMRDRKLFLDAVYSSPHYFPALHHPSMRAYPFFDVVGLDLVLTQDMDALQTAGEELPFRLLEINAGAPSGAANNLHILDGLQRIDPELISNLGTVLPNDHFAILRAAYDCLGRSWTGESTGISVLVPPGGENGATPEIHELAARSGLVYCNADQIYTDGEGAVRMRTIDGSDPRVTAMYSRVNADSLLYDPKRNVVLRDPESGEPLSLRDPLRESEEGDDAADDLPPVESLYQIPGIIDAVHARRVYLGGLNRVLDNKIILDILCTQAPLFYERKLRRRGIDVQAALKLLPPRSLPSTSRTLKQVLEDPDRWVIKAPNLSGGKGIHILRCLTPRARAKVFKAVRLDPSRFALQELVPIGRIPIPVRQNRRFRYANVAADLRMWVFYGDGENFPKPRLTRNALVRTAPKEKGPLSSIVNTSMGGGYAGMVVVDDDPATSQLPRWDQRLVVSAPPAPDALPLGVGAQLRQTARITRELLRCARSGGSPAQISFLVTELRSQVREVMSFLDQNCIETVQGLVQLVKGDSNQTVLNGRRVGESRVAIVDELSLLTSPVEFREIFSKLDTMGLWDFSRPYTAERRMQDEEKLRALSSGRGRQRLARLVARVMDLRSREAALTEPRSEQVFDLARQFLASCQEAILVHPTSRALAPFFDLSYRDEPRIWGGVHPQSLKDAQRVATWWEWWNQKSLLDEKFLEPQLLEARHAWRRVLDEASDMSPVRRAAFIHTMRQRHHERFPFLDNLQAILDGRSSLSWLEAVHELLKILPHARFNLSALAARQGITLSELLVTEPRVGRVAVLPRSLREERGWSLTCAGECSVHKPSPRALFSESEIFVWVAAEAHPFVAAYTAGHEAIHAVQLEALVEAELFAREAGELAWVDFAHRGSALLEETYADEQAARADVLQGRISLQGFSYSRAFGHDTAWVRSLLRAAEEGAASWNAQLGHLGMVAGLATEPSAAARVRALREVVPAIENAKNIRFVKELGLRWHASAVRAALPCASAVQREALAPAVERLIEGLQPDPEDLRVVANCQQNGVYFPRVESPESTFSVEAGFGALGYGGVGCQSQQ